MLVVTVGALEQVWLRAYINETDLGRAKVRQRVRVTTDERRIRDAQSSLANVRRWGR